MNNLGKRPLEGVTVISLEQAVAAPFATRQLADLGARVVKIERPGEGDFAPHYDRSVKGMSSHFVWLNRSKESLSLDLKHPAGKEVLPRSRVSSPSLGQFPNWGSTPTPFCKSLGIARSRSLRCERTAPSRGQLPRGRKRDDTNTCQYDHY